MRKEMYRMADAEARAFLERAPVVRVASTTPDGAPVIRTVHAVLLDGAVVFHGAPAGEKMEAVGRDAVVVAEEVVASIPSYFVDPERACPATTYYLSAHVHGRIERVDDAPAKARALAALMAKYQPEGGYAALDATHPLYVKALNGVVILRVPIGHVDGKAKLGQNRRPDELRAILTHLWARGAPGDARAIDLVRAANPSVLEPEFLACPAGVRLACALGPSDVPAGVRLLEGTYWNEGVSPQAMAHTFLHSQAWVGARDPSGALVAMARAVGDGAKCAFVFDVVVDPAWRGKGLGKAIVRLILDHPVARRARRVRLVTRDAHGLYAQFGFRTLAERPLHPPQNEMVFERIL